MASEVVCTFVHRHLYPWKEVIIGERWLKLTVVNFAQSKLTGDQVE